MRREMASRPRGRPWQHGPAGDAAESWSAGAVRESDRIILRIEMPSQTLTFDLTPESAARLGKELTEATGLLVFELDPEEEN